MAYQQRMRACAATLLLCGALPGKLEPQQGRVGAPAPIEAISLLGDTLRRPAFDSASRARMEEQLAEAQRDFTLRPTDRDALIWVGRRLAYLGRYGEAISAFSLGIRRFPDDPRFYRHRGHRYITVRRFDDAVRDLEKAAALMAGRPDEVEPDGQPNARNLPIGSLQSNVWYHLALAHYLKGDWDKAAEAARRGIDVSSNADRLVSQTHWLYMALRRAGRADEARSSLAAIRDDFEIIENGSYYTLVKLYRNEASTAADTSETALANPSDLSLAYGLANRHLYSGDTARAERALARIVGSSQWASFGFVAAEADLARLRRRAAK